jgi:hypothetical protein
LEKLLAYVNKHKWLGFVFGFVIAGLILILLDSFMFFLSTFLADYLVVGLLFLLGLLGVLRLLGNPAKIPPKEWLVLVLLWAGALIILYGHGLKERNVESARWGPWSLIGVLLFNLPIAMWAINALLEKRKSTR